MDTRKGSIPTIEVAKPRRADLTRQCVESIQEYIKSHGITPGERLPSLQEWASMLEVSIAVVREAFRVLEALDVVDIQHGRGIFLASPEEMDFLGYLSLRHSLDHFSLQEVIEGRAMLELTVLETCIARATEEDIARLENDLDRLRRDPPPVGEDSPHHKRFHYTMLEICGDRLLLSLGVPLLNTFWALGNTGRIALPGNVRQTGQVAIHEAYVDAIKRRDLSRTRELVDRHLLGLCSRYGVFPYAKPQHTPNHKP